MNATIHTENNFTAKTTLKSVTALLCTLLSYWKRKFYTMIVVTYVVDARNVPYLWQCIMYVTFFLIILCVLDMKHTHDISNSTYSATQRYTFPQFNFIYNFRCNWIDLKLQFEQICLNHFITRFTWDEIYCVSGWTYAFSDRTFYSRFLMLSRKPLTVSDASPEINSG